MNYTDVNMFGGRIVSDEFTPPLTDTRRVNTQHEQRASNWDYVRPLSELTKNVYCIKAAQDFANMGFGEVFVVRLKHADLFTYQLLFPKIKVKYDLVPSRTVPFLTTKVREFIMHPDEALGMIAGETQSSAIAPINDEIFNS